MSGQAARCFELISRALTGGRSSTGEDVMPTNIDSDVIAIRRSQICCELKRFRVEACHVLETLVLPNWETDLHGFTHMLYGSMMRAFSYIDLLSAYWGGPGQAQTGRMVNFMDRYIGYERKAHSVAVQLWRHKLMHTAQPRKLNDPATGKTMYWLLQWYEQHLPRKQHFTFSDAGHQVNLNIGAMYLIEDIERAAIEYFDELEESHQLQQKAEATENELNSYELRSI